ncbi:MAG: hypothetical protein EOM20_18185 [Spartobacteria bacterium]|nr:hypothetical protein [Spartobacteria bacterium]
MKKIIIIAAMAVLAGSAFAQISDTLSVSATLQAGVSTIDVVQNSLDFGNIAVSEGLTRFVSSDLTMDAFAANGPWYIRVSTANPGNLMGLVDDTTGTHNLLMKMWQPGFGPEAGLPDPNVETNWRGNEAFWAFVFDDSETDPVTGEPVHSKIAQSANEDGTDFTFNLAIDASGAPADSYSSVVTFELVIE